VRARRRVVGLGTAVCLTAAIWTAGPVLAAGSGVVDPPARPPLKPYHDQFARGGLPFTGAAVALMTSVAVALVVAGLVMVAIQRRDAEH